MYFMLKVILTNIDDSQLGTFKEVHVCIFESSASQLFSD